MPVCKLYLWGYIAKRYLGIDFSGIELDSEALKLRTQIERSVEAHSLTLPESILLLITMDHAAVKVTDVPELLKLMRKFADEHPESGFKQLAELLEAMSLPEDGWIALSDVRSPPLVFKVLDEGAKPGVGSAWDVFKRLRSISQQRLLKGV